MRFRALRRHWDRLGRRDPLWAVLTDPDKRDGGWDVEQFFRAGTDELSAVLERAARLGVAVSRRRGLDFGCGVGRVTQAMAASFDRCDGVDISASMLRLARQHNRHPDRCSYHLNVAPNLALFQDGSFTFVFSTLVLQHIEPRYSTGYIRELLRVLAPGGLLVFQLPSHRAPRAIDHAVSSAIAGPLPPEACRARLAAEPASLRAQAGEEIVLRVAVENRSASLWPSLPDSRGHFRINVANHWLTEGGGMFLRDDRRCPLPHDVPPSSRVEVMLAVTAPRFDGDYWLELDLVQEEAGWFGQRGSETLRIACHVTGGLPHPSPRAQPAPTEVTPVRPFRERHPRILRVLKATGLRDAYWAWRRWQHRRLMERDRLIIWVSRRVYIPLRDRLHQHAGAALINWWRKGAFAPRMEMHCIPRAEVLAIVASCGGRVVDVGEEPMSGGFQSCRYWIVKEGARSNGAEAGI